MTSIVHGIFSAILIVFMLVLDQSNSEANMEVVHDKCLTENDITREEFSVYVNSTSSEEEYEDNIERKFKCYIQCLAREMDLVDADGYVDVEFLEKNGKLSEENWFAFSECKEENDYITDVCDYAHKFMFCLQEKIDIDKLDNESE